MAVHGGRFVFGAASVDRDGLPVAREMGRRSRRGLAAAGILTSRGHLVDIATDFEFEWRRCFRRWADQYLSPSTAAHLIVELNRFAVALEM
jgi:hypothetical protein